MEAFGLAIFMASACFFSSQLEGIHSSWHQALPNGTLRLVFMGLAMGLTALLIFYSPLTAPSGSHINPAVTIAFLRVKRITGIDAVFYILFQLIGGVLAVYLMAWLLKDQLTQPPVNYVVTRPAMGELPAIITELIIGFVMMTMVLNISSNPQYSRYTRVIAAGFVVMYVILAGPISGFGMNPARSLASAIPSGIYDSIWMYIVIPILSMWLAAELFIYQTKTNSNMKKHFKYHWVLWLPFFFLANTASAQVSKVEAVGITVRDMETSVNFFHNVLSFNKTSDQTLDEQHARIVRMKLGDELIELTQFIPSDGRAIPADMQSNDLYFQHIAIVVSDMDKAYAVLSKYMVGHISTVPQTIPMSNKAAAGVKAFYFHDPDNHDLELIYFPKGKGQPKWQQPNGQLFLGIDHTAIGITNTDKSMSFYQDLLGFEHKGESWNMGMEQIDLSNVKSASLHITALRAVAGPGVEFLQYLKPGPGKPYPTDTKTKDIWYWQVTLVTNQLDNLYQKLKAANFHFITDNIVQLKYKDEPAFRAFVVQDPDGHALLIKD